MWYDYKEEVKLVLKEKFFCEEDIRPKNLLALQAACVQEDIESLLKYKEEFILTSCVACESDVYELIYEKNGFFYVRCKACGTIFLNPRPTIEILSQFYRQSKNYKFWSEYIFPETEQNRRKNIVAPRVDRILEICKRHHINQNVILEVGAAYGSFCEELESRKEFESIIAVEPTPDLAQICRDKGLNVIESFIEDVPLDTINADVIVNFEVIEHLYNPKKFLQEVSKNIKPGGILVTSCPNGEGFDVLMLGKESSSVDHEHLNYFNVRSLPQLMRSIGLEIIEVLTPGELDVDLVRSAMKDKKIDLSQNLFFKKIFIDDWDQMKDPFQNFLRANLLSSHMWIIAKKPEI